MSGGGSGMIGGVYVMHDEAFIFAQAAVVRLPQAVARTIRKPD